MSTHSRLHAIAQAGFSHIVLPIAILAVAVSAVAVAGTRIVGNSSAATVADICGKGYQKTAEFYLHNKTTGEQAHYKTILAILPSNNEFCAFTMGTDAAASDTVPMIIEEWQPDICSVPSCTHTHQGTYKGRTPTVKWQYRSLSSENALYSYAIRNGNTNILDFKFKTKQYAIINV